MRVITAPEEYKYNGLDTTIFLAGGICNCDNWQDIVIDELEKEFKDDDHIIVFNPRRKTFDMSNPKETEIQITWEFKYLQLMKIFTMFFANNPSDQPICMYELGRNLVRMEFFYDKNYKDRVVISACDGYSRKNDVVIQSGLVGFTVNSLGSDNTESAKQHAKFIIESVRKIKRVAS